MATIQSTRLLYGQNPPDSVYNASGRSFRAQFYKKSWSSSSSHDHRWFMNIFAFWFIKKTWLSRVYEVIYPRKYCDWIRSIFCGGKTEHTKFLKVLYFTACKTLLQDYRQKYNTFLKLSLTLSSSLSFFQFHTLRTTLDRNKKLFFVTYVMAFRVKKTWISKQEVYNNTFFWKVHQ